MVISVEKSLCGSMFVGLITVLLAVAAIVYLVGGLMWEVILEMLGLTDPDKIDRLM